MSDLEVMLVGLAIAAVLVTFGISQIRAGIDWKAEKQPLAGGVLAEGRYVDVIKDGGKRGRTYRAECVYYDTAGKPHGIISRSGRTPPDTTGVVRISYDPADPVRARDLTTGKDAWRFPYWTGIALVVAGGLTLIGFVSSLVRRRSGRTSRR